VKVDATTVEEFFAAAGERESALRELDMLIRSAAPSLKRQLHAGVSITMLGYGAFDYQTKSGSKGRWPVVAIAPQKNYISLYVCAVADGKYLTEQYQDRLGKVSCGKSCIRMKKFTDLNQDTVKIMLEELETRVKRGEKPFGF
jgi:nucleoid DNA-binding protein